MRVLGRRSSFAAKGLSLLGLTLSLVGSAAYGASSASIPVHLGSSADNEVCLGCHAEGASSGSSAHLPRVDAKAYQASVHGQRACTECHEDITTIPHRAAEKVRCGRCHPAMQGNMAIAGKGVGGGAHADALRAGKENAPDCATCHGTHNITGPSDRGSRVNRANVPATCGKCHLEEYAQYRHSVHGAAVARGVLEAAVCIDCHGEHSGLRAKSDPTSSISPLQVPNTCGRCHESTKIAQRYGLPSARYSTYRESYHGIAAKFGDVRVANCASCHGFHDILPSSDPESRVNHNRLPATCGKCHPGASANFARGTVHLMPSPKQDAIVYWVRIGYRIFVSLLMAQFLGLIGLDLFARWREGRRGAHV